MPTIEAIRKPQKENINPNKELQSNAFTIPYTYRRLFGGGMDSFRDPFSRSIIQSEQKTELQFAEGAFSLPKDPAPLRKICHSLSISPPISKEDIPEFVRSQIAEIKDSEGNNHFENQLLTLLFPPPGKEHEVINAIQATYAPENPDSCAEIEVTLNGEKLEAHAHGSYQGNNKSRIALFALLGHKPSQTFLAKWVEKDILSDKTAAHHHSKNHEAHEEHEHHTHEHDDHNDYGHDHSHNHSQQVTFNGSPEEIAQQVASVISQRLEAEAHHDAHEESVENAELSQEERIDSVASVTIAHVISPEDEDIQKTFDQIANNNYIGQLDLKKKEPEPLQQENEALTEHFITTLKVLREEVNQEQDEQTLQKRNVLLTLSLARLHNKEITLKDILADHEYPPKNEKTATIMLAKAIAVATRPGLNQQNLPQNERDHKNTALQLRQNYGISFINYTTSHNANNPFHKIVKPNGIIDSCPDHAQETARLDQKLKESHKTVREKLKQTYQPKRTLAPKTGEVVRGVVQKKDTAQTQLTRPTLETLVAFGNTEASEKLQSLEKQEAWEKRFNAAAAIIHGAVLVRNETTQELVDTLMGGKFFGEITEEQIVRKPSKAIRESNEKHTVTFKEKLAEARKEKFIDSQKLALTLAKMHDPTVETLTFDEKIPEYTQLTRADVIKILALDMALQTESEKKPQTPQSKKIARYARRINEEKGIHYVNLTMNHATALHLVETVKGGEKVVDACPDHTQQVDKMLKKMQTVTKQQVTQFNQIPTRILPFNHLQPMRGGGIEQPKKTDKKRVAPPSSELPPNRLNGRSQQRPVTRAGKERPVSFRPPIRHDSRRPRKNEQTKNVDVKPEAKRRQQLTAFVQRAIGATGFVPSYFKRVNTSAADFRITISAPQEQERPTVLSKSPDKLKATPLVTRGATETLPQLKTRAEITANGMRVSVASDKLTVTLHDAPTGKKPEGMRIVPDAEADHIFYVPHKEKSIRTAHHSETKVKPASEQIALLKVRTAIVQETQKATSRAPEQKIAESLSHEAVVIPFPTNRKPKTKQRLTSGNGAKAALVVLAEKRGQLQTTSVKKEASAALAKPQSKIQLRLVKSDTGIAPNKAPTHATFSAPKEAPNVAIRPAEKPTLTLVTKEDVGIDKIPAGLKTTNNPSEATGGHSISIGKGSRRSSTNRTSSKRSSESSSNRGSDQPQNTFNPHATATNSMKKVTGEQTARQVEQAFAKKEEAEVEQQVTKQMKQAAQTIEEEAQVAQGANKTKTAKNHEGTNAGIGEHTEDRDTVVQTETGEYAKVREKTSRVSVGGTSHLEIRQSEENQISDKDSTGQSTSATAAQRTKQVNADIGTNEEAQQVAGQQQQPASVTPTSSRRRKQQRSHMSLQTVTAQIAASDGYYLPTDPFGARDAFRQAFAEIAA